MEFPSQFTGGRSDAPTPGAGLFDMREKLTPRRLTMAMWDQAFVLRHQPGGSYEDFDKVLDETIERGYNTVRLDPMPQWIDLSRPERVLTWPDPNQIAMPWAWNTAVEGPVGQWIIEFMEKLLARKLHYTLSAWWFWDESRGPKLLGLPHTHREAVDLWLPMLRQWKSRFGFDGLVYLDISNEVPYFLPDFTKRFEQETGASWFNSPTFSTSQIAFLADDLNSALKPLHEEFPELRVTASIHGDVRWLDVPVEFDCLDVHFYADADERWVNRTQFKKLMPALFTDVSFHKEFSDRCMATHRAIAPMLRARQRNKLAAFAGWANRRGMPLTTSESWSSWFYVDSPNLDWSWLLEWAQWSVDDAIEFGMWGWTPHNYCQPQFDNWKDARWHRQLCDRFLKS